MRGIVKARLFSDYQARLDDPSLKLKTMKSSELRIGNYVLYHKDEPYQIEDGIDIDNANIFQPVPLTEEWLLKFGFEKIVANNYQIKFLVDEYGMIENNGGYYSPHINTSSGWKNIGNDVMYVHQLQNLYFALTGEELKTI